MPANTPPFALVSGPRREPPPPLGSATWLANLLLVAVATLLASEVGIVTRVADSSVSSFWPASGIGFAAMLLLGRRVWPGVLAGAAIAAVMAGTRLGLALGTATGTTLALLLATTLMERSFGFRTDLKRTQDMVALIVGSALVAAPIAAAFGTVWLFLFGRPNPEWTNRAGTWWIGDALGTLLVAPFVLAVVQRVKRTKRGMLEIMVAAAIAGLVTWMVFSGTGADGYPVNFAVFPVVLWAGLQLGVIGTAAVNAAIGFVVFALARPIHEPQAYEFLHLPSSTVIGLFLIVVACSGLILASAVSEAKSTERAMRAAEAQHRNHLERRVVERTAELRALNAELESFSYSVAHDLRGPLRTIAGFSQIVLDEEHASIQEESRDLLTRTHRAAVRMGRLVDSLLNLSRINRSDLSRTAFDISALAIEVAQETQAATSRSIEWRIAPNLNASGDSRLLRLVLANLFENAVKFCSHQATPVVEFGKLRLQGEECFFVRDNGVGFDPTFTDKLFLPFQRLHSRSEFEGEGIGLATVERIIRRHGGRIWAEGRPGGGATFTFTLSFTDGGDLPIDVG